MKMAESGFNKVLYLTPSTCIKKCFWGYTVCLSICVSVSVSVCVQNASDCQRAGGVIKPHIVKALVFFLSSFVNLEVRQFLIDQSEVVLL